MLIEHLLHHLHLEEVVAGAKASELRTSPLHGAVGDRRGPGVFQHPKVLTELSVFLPSHALGEWKANAVLKHLLHLASREPHPTLLADAPWNEAAERMHELTDLRANVPFPFQFRTHEPHPAGDVESHAAGRDDAPVVDVRGRYPSDGKAVTPVDVRHRIGGSDDARKGGHVRHLLDRPILLRLLGQLLSGEHDPRDAHAGHTSLRDLPDEFFDAFEFHGHPDLECRPRYGPIRPGRCGRARSRRAPSPRADDGRWPP
jgi:hypothetical protein